MSEHQKPTQEADLTQEVAAHELTSRACLSWLVAIYLNTQGWELCGKWLLYQKEERNLPRRADAEIVDLLRQTAAGLVHKYEL